ncbi:NIF3-like protein 1 isoform X1 [Latimeria chalumnae]|nr:PREDICTED: NIF3-like protein 1 isoform X2 [Latimeria chalumnae]|eukprot:XP_006004863.1 PREDICTED: NIF3-like protein 1 isoform X2 [Latimeria chalumnae]
MLARCLFALPRQLLQAHSSACAVTQRATMDLSKVVSSLDEFAALSLAESWDNVGLLVEPSPPHTVRTLFLTNDLTEDVMGEALAQRADLILAYHPPIFRPLKRVTWRTWKERLVVQALENRVAIYSPHTVYDALPNGVNKWLAKGLGVCSTEPIQLSTASAYPSLGSHRIEFSVHQSQDLDGILSSVWKIQGISVSTLPVRCDGEERTRVCLNTTQQALPEVMALLSQNGLTHRVEIIPLQKPPLPNTGMGRLCQLKEPVSIATVVERIKNHLKLNHVRLALGSGKTLDSVLKTAAVCAGSGGSVLQGIEADLYLTGEMSHHDVLDAVAKGTSVVLCEHSNTERGFLSELKEMLTARFHKQLKVIVSSVDKDPLQVL